MSFEGKSDTWKRTNDSLYGMRRRSLGLEGTIEEVGTGLSRLHNRMLSGTANKQVLRNDLTMLRLWTDNLMREANLTEENKSRLVRYSHRIDEFDIVLKN